MSGLDKAFDEWWDSEPLIADNIYPQDTPVYWAWEGWQAAMKAEREACAKLFDGEVWAYDYREIAAAIRARGNDAA
jgi:hypothetical protein